MRLRPATMPEIYEVIELSAPAISALVVAKVVFGRDPATRGARASDTTADVRDFDRSR